ncbi:linoleate 13S-lipoxygenase 2-1, chloroplastic-like protein [Tanacetum coccineum]
MNNISSLYLVLGMDFSQTNHEIQPGLAETEGTKSIINEAITRLSVVIKRLREVKIERMQRVNPLTGSRTLLPFYVPIDEDFSEIKEVTFGARTLYSVLHGVMPILDLVVTDKDKVFPLFTSIGFLFNQSVNVPAPDNGILSALPRLVKGEPDATNNFLFINGFDLSMGDKFSWFRNEAFCRQMLVGLNPCSIQLVTIDIHFVHDLVAARQVRVLHVPSRYQFADIFTKGLPSALFEEFRTSLSINVDKHQVKPAIKAQHDQQIDDDLLAEARFCSDVEVTEKEIECMVMEASRVEYIANDKFNHQLGRRESSTPEPSYSGGTKEDGAKDEDAGLDMLYRTTSLWTSLILNVFSTSYRSDLKKNLNT